MTSPPEPITVECPNCRHEYEDWFRPSINLTLDDFDDDYLDRCSSATCPNFGCTVKIDVLVVDKNGTFTMRSG